MNKENLLKCLLACVAQHGGTCTQDQFQSMFRYPSIEDIIAAFGAWEEAMTEFENHPKYRVKRPRKTSKIRSKQYTDDYLLEILKEFKSTISPTTATNYEKWRKIKGATIPSRHTICQRFGSWTNALAHIDAQAGEAGRIKIDDEKLIQALRDFISQNKGNPTIHKYEKWRKMNSRPAAVTIMTRFGSWKTAQGLMQLRTCPSCKSSFKPRSPRQIYCLSSCRYRFREVAKREERKNLGLCPQCGGTWIDPLPTHRGQKPNHCKRCQEYYQERYRRQK